MQENHKTAFAICGARLFDGEAFHDHETERRAVVVEGGAIRDIVSMDSLAGGMPKVDAREHLLAPGYIDLQVNGGGGALLNEKPSVEVVRKIASAHRAFGTTGMLPTVITDNLATVKEAVTAVGAARQQGVPGILGVHVEGIYIDTPKRGAHPVAFIRPVENDAQISAEIAWLKSANCGDVMLTISPNKISPAVIADLAKSDIIVTLGHSEASYEQAMAALAAGARGFTHLYNAMSPLTHRQPGMVGAALADAESFCGIIADGYHVEPAALKIAIAAKKRGKIVLVTDAMPTAAGGPLQFNLLGQKAAVKDGRLELPDGTLAGSNITMDQAVRFAIDELDVEVGEALRMASLYPAAFIKRDKEYGRVAPGYRASLVLLDKRMRVRATWIDGQADRKLVPSKS
jgi:N-acetylglucosamine-6-phosphate deacetylase